jgi:hypothetical protein
MVLAGRAAREVLDLAGTALRAGMTTDDIDALVHAETVKRGGYPSPLNYHGVVLWGGGCSFAGAPHQCGVSHPHRYHGRPKSSRTKHPSRAWVCVFMCWGSSPFEIYHPEKNILNIGNSGLIAALGGGGGLGFPPRANQGFQSRCARA